MVDLTMAEERVRRATPGDSTRIRQEIDESVKYYGRHPERIASRVASLEKEWDIERTLELNAAALSLAGVVMAALTKKRGWLALPAIVAAFLMQHSVQGWCPPLPLLRKMGVRTMDEILREKTSLQFLKGSFDDLLRHGNRSTAEKIESVIRAFR